MTGLTGSDIAAALATGRRLIELGAAGAVHLSPPGGRGRCVRIEAPGGGPLCEILRERDLYVVRDGHGRRLAVGRRLRDVLAILLLGVPHRKRDDRRKDRGDCGGD